MNARKRMWYAASAPLIIALAAALLPSGTTVYGEKVALQSPELVKQLVTLMTGKKLNAMAAKEPEAADRYVAAMLFPGVQLLVISGAASSPAYIDSEMASGRYDSVYGALHQAPAASKLFIQDMGADGIHALDGGVVDVVWERGVTQHVLDGDHRAAKKSEQQYAKLVQDLDARYSGLLKLLIAQAQAISSPGLPSASRR